LKINYFQNLSGIGIPMGFGMAMNPKQLNEIKNSNLSDMINITFRISGSSNDIPPIL